MPRAHRFRPGISERPGRPSVPQPSRGAGRAEAKGSLPTHGGGGSRLSSLGTGAWPKGRQQNKTQLFRSWGVATRAGTQPHQLAAISAQFSAPGDELQAVKTATRIPGQSPSEYVSLSTSNLCPKSLFGLKVTLQLSICTNAMKERRGSVSQFIFQIGDKN